MNTTVETQNAVTLSAVKGAWLRYHPHRLGVILQTGFQEFETPMCGVGGLAKEYDRTIEILAVHASQPGTGQFRHFIDELKDSFDTIFILEVWNPDLQKTLKRYGFTRMTREEPDETITGFRWNAREAQSVGRASPALCVSGVSSPNSSSSPAPYSLTGNN